jgi:hypothetical protein
MPKRISKKKEDVNQTAYRVLQQTIAESETKSPDPEIDRALLSRVMSEMGRKGGKIGGKKRLQTLSPSRRRTIARRAARARWKKIKH